MQRKKVTSKPLPENTVQYLDEPKIDFSNIPPKLRKGKLKSLDSAPSTTKKRKLQKQKDNQCSHSKELKRHESTENSLLHHHDHDDWTTIDSEIPAQDQDLLYRILLQRNRYFAPCTSDFMSFAIADFDAKNQEILKHHIHIVTRQSKSFVNECVWLYSCTCDEANAAYIDSLPAIINTSSNDFSSKTCIHINATQKLIASTDNIEELTPSLTDDHCYGKKHETEGLDIWEVDFPEPMVGVFGYDGLPGVVGKSNAGLQCFTCQSRQCYHCKKINKLISSSDLEQIPDALIQLQILVEQTQENPVPSYTYQSVSKERIQFKPSDHVLEYLTGDYSNFLLEDGFYHFWPDEDSNCPSCGSSWSEECFQQGKNDFIYLYDRYHVLKAKVYGKDCSNEDCSEKLMFDGGKMAILNMKTFLIPHSLFRDYMWHYLYGRCTLHTYFQIWKQHQNDIKSVRFLEMTYTKFRHSWYEYLKLLDIPFDQEFQCNICKDNPSIVVCDATSLACQKTFVNWTENEPYHDDKPLIEGSRYKDRVFLPDKQTRQLINAYCTKGFENADQFLRLKALVKKHCPSLVKLFSHIEMLGCTNSCPSEFNELLLTLCSSSPVCAVLPPSDESIHLIRRIIEKSKDEDSEILSSGDWKLLQLNSPILFKIMNKLRRLASYLQPIFEQMAFISENTFSNFGGIIDDSLLEHENSKIGSYFPALPQQRKRGLFKADASTKLKSGSECAKQSTRHPTLLPGIFTAFCSHGVCYGFQVMQCNESPNVPFTFFRTRFKKAPSVIIYDNACNLQNYALNRDPAFFKETKFVVDNLHWKNHKGCSKVYHAKEHPSLSGINTQMVEQNNSKLQKLKSQLSYMNYDNFILHLKFFLWYCNYKTCPS